MEEKLGMMLHAFNHNTEGGAIESGRSQSQASLIYISSLNKNERKKEEKKRKRLKEENRKCMVATHPSSD